MSARRAWSVYPISYRTREVALLARWIMTNSSGSVVGLPGIGKSNLLGFLCHRPDILSTHLPKEGGRVTLISVDLNILPANDLATLYRTVLRSFYESREQLEATLSSAIRDLYLENRSARDPFLSQSALRELLQQFQARNHRVVLVFDRFDKFCEHATMPMTDTLRGLRDGFKDTLSYIVGMRQEVAYLPDPAGPGELFELLDMNVCWVGALDKTDARQLIATVTNSAVTTPAEPEIIDLLQLSGGHPALLKAACHWWLTTVDRPSTGWKEALLNERSISFRLEEIWSALSQEEQRVLSDVHLLDNSSRRKASSGRPSYESGDGTVQGLGREDKRTLDRLVEKGVGQWNTEEGAFERWTIRSSLLAAHVSKVGGRSRGKLWFDEKRRLIYQGRKSLENLQPLEGSLMKFLIAHPRERLTYTELIEAAWPEEVNKEGVTTEALYQVVRGLRRKIEPTPSQPRYIVNWRGKPEGGYVCFPEGRPR